MELPHQGVKPLGYFIALWLAGWYVLLCTTCIGILSRPDPEILIILVLGVFVGMGVLRIVLWYFFGREVVTIEGGYFTLERKGSFAFPTLSLSPDEVEGIVLITRRRLWLSEKMRGGTKLSVHYLGRRSNFGRCSTQEDATDLLPILTAWLKAGKTAPSHH